MTAPSEAQMARLPKWAYEEITRLRGETASLRSRLAGGFSESDTFVEHIAQGVSQPLGIEPLISFYTGEVERRAVGHIEATIVGPSGGSRRLQLRCPVGGLIVRPQSSNVITVEAPGEW
jgi:hypothetical protein